MKLKKTKLILFLLCLSFMVIEPISCLTTTVNAKSAYDVEFNYNPSRTVAQVTVYNAPSESTAIDAFISKFNDRNFRLTECKGGIFKNSKGEAYEFSYSRKTSYGYLLYYNRI